MVNFPNMNELMQKAKSMQEEMEKTQQAIARLNIEGKAPTVNPLVTVSMRGNHFVEKVVLDTSLLDEDKEMVEDLITAAINAAVAGVQEKVKQLSQGVSQGLNMPAGFEDFLK